jgi:hypothetical protein
MLILIAMYCCFAPLQSLRQTRDVCNLIRDAAKLEGRIVIVSGILQASDPSSEKPYFDELIAENCSGLRTKRIRIQIVSPDSHFLANPPKGFNPDMDSVRRAEELLARSEKQGRRIRQISATVAGVFYSPQRQAATSRDSVTSRHEQYDGYLILESFKDLRIP